MMFMNRIKMGALSLLAAGTVAVGVITVASSATRPPGRDESDPPKAGALPEGGKPAGPGKAVAKLLPVKTGDLLRIEVLEALPGRPITGTRIVRPDGTISLEFYGDLYVEGLTRDQIKAKLIEHLRKFLFDEILGLVEMDEQGKSVVVNPVDSNRVFVEDHIYQRGDQERRLEALETKMEEILTAVRNLGTAPAAPPQDVPVADQIAAVVRNLGIPPAAPPPAAPPPAPTPRPRDAAAPPREKMPKNDPLLPPPTVPSPPPTRIRGRVPASDPFLVSPFDVPVPLPPVVPPAPGFAGAGTPHEERLREMERKLDQILERLGGGRGGPRDRDLPHPPE